MSQNQPEKQALGKIDPVQLPADSPDIIHGSPAPSAAPNAMPPQRGLPQHQGMDNGKGLKSFLGALVKPGADQQKPDQGLAERLRSMKEKEANLPPGQKQGKAAGLFDAIDAPLRGLTTEDLRFADEVDAALSRRPKFGVRLLSLTVAALLLLLIIWAAIAQVDEVTHSEGQVIGSQRTQTIQNLEGGILESIDAHEGQIVEKGAILARINNESAAASYRDAVSKAIENNLALIRLEAELRGEKPVFPADIRQWLTKRLGLKADNTTSARAMQMLRDQENTWLSRSKLLESDLEVLRTQHAQREKDVQEQEAHLKQLEASLSLAIDQRNTAVELMRRKNFARMEYLNLEQKVVEQKGQIDMLNASIPRAKAAAEEALQRISSREAEQKQEISQDISKRRLELNSLRETLAAGADRVIRTELRAPVRGTIRKVYINTVGGVVKPGEPIMDLVPLEDTLLVESKVLPKDVAFLHPGQNVMVKVTAYDFSIYGGLEGKLESISADTIEDKRGEYYYVAKVRTPKTVIEHNNEILPIIPGMMVTADILIGKKSILDYLLKPILKARDNALRER